MRQVSVIAATVTGLAGLLPSAVFSESGIPISECEFSESYGPTVSNEEHANIGNGFVLYAERMVDEKNSGDVFVANCFSGSTLVVDYTGQKQRDMVDFVLAAAASPEKWTLSRFRGHFSSLGLWTSLGVSSREHCACAAFYPEAKGDKADWQTRYGHP